MVTGLFLFLLAATAQPASSPAPPAFRAATIVSGLGMGYQLVVADLNRDRRPDVVVVDERSTELAWYENPTWTRHVLITGVPRVINLDTHDLDGDGIPEIAMAHQFETDPSRSVGQVLLLTHGDDPTQPWTSKPIDTVPTAHRVRWMRVEAGKSPWLLVAPFAGAGVVAPKYAGRTPIYAYVPGTWTRQRISSTLTGIVHSIHPVEWAPGRWQLLTASFDGVQRVVPREGEWTHVPITSGNLEPCPRCGTSEIKLGRLGARRFLATIEPFHGNIVAVYLDRATGWERLVIEDGMTNGHALAVADLDGDGQDEIVASHRGKDVRVSVYRAADATGTRWSRTVLDQGGVAGADCKVADLTGDGKLDIVCSGASTGNVVLFEQQK
ncbi:hypothetical protein TBR22_A43170 [Luteitalea sp. TBR-22]|uniref:FG-GAP repeat domain-containing protein n=1 Tax=Luteitalea sp. TBR-22 TaxID=2802971 RepID=UPI001AF5F224|nr:VCBS repeat-containing protein [Luteitalea sp. TBR-22]BCS35091.1 hypothetical protein TBR22_A43170 [Luteitalea sp. TBR-22]